MLLNGESLVEVLGLRHCLESWVQRNPALRPSGLPAYEPTVSNSHHCLCPCVYVTQRSRQAWLFATTGQWTTTQ